MIVVGWFVSFSRAARSHVDPASHGYSGNGHAPPSLDEPNMAALPGPLLPIASDVELGPETRVYLAGMFRAEMVVTNTLARLAAQEPISFQGGRERVLTWLHKHEKLSGRGAWLVSSASVEK